MIDHLFYRFTGAINHAGCWEKTRKACKSRVVRRVINKLFSCFPFIPSCLLSQQAHRKIGLLLLWNNYRKLNSVNEKKFCCTLVINLIFLIKFMRWRDKPITATQRMKEQTQRGTQIRGSKLSDEKHFISFCTRKVWNVIYRKGRTLSLFQNFHKIALNIGKCV